MKNGNITHVCKMVKKHDMAFHFVEYIRASGYFDEKRAVKAPKTALKNALAAIPLETLASDFLRYGMVMFALDCVRVSNIHDYAPRRILAQARQIDA